MCSVHFVRGRFGRLLWNSVEIAQNRRRTRCTEHASKKIRRSKRLELYIFQIFSSVSTYFVSQQGCTLTTHTPQIRGVAFSPPKFQGWVFKSTVKQAFFDNPPPKSKGQISPPKFGGYGLSGYGWDTLVEGRGDCNLGIL